jgi:RND family efflux transporter MFP subunit
MPRNLDIEQLTIDRSVTHSKRLFSSLIAKMLLSITLLFTLFGGAFVIQAYQPSNQGQTSVSKVTQIVDTNKQVNTLSANVVISTSDVTQTHNPLNKSTDTIVNSSVLDASGYIVARRIATVSSRVTGKLNKLIIEEGQRVQSDQIIAELDDRQARISYQLAQADLTANIARFHELNIVHKHELQRLKRQQILFNKSLISEQFLDDSRFTTEKIAAQLTNKKALMDLSKQKVALAQYQLEQHKIRAPFDGVVISKNAQVGELISSGSSGGGFIRTGVGTIVDMSSLEIEVEVAESYINRVHANQKTIATLDAYPNWPISSEVIAVIPTADRQKASIKVRVKLHTTDTRILPDMGVKVSFLKG